MLDHEKLDVYKISIQFTAWAYNLCKRFKGIDRHARDQLIRASQSIPLNIAEGNGKLPSADRQRYLRIARGSALECASILDVLNVCNVCDIETVTVGKKLIVRIVSMLSKMDKISYRLREESEIEYEYGYE